MTAPILAQRMNIYLRDGIRISHRACWLVSWNLQFSVVGQEQALSLAVVCRHREGSINPPETCAEPLLVGIPWALRKKQKS